MTDNGNSNGTIAAAGGKARSLGLLQEIEVRLSVEIGATALRIRDLLALNPGSVVELDRQASDMADIYINGTLLARGEVVTIGDRFAVRVGDIVAAGERINGL